MVLSLLSGLGCVVWEQVEEEGVRTVTPSVYDFTIGHSSCESFYNTLDPGHAGWGVEPHMAVTARTDNSGKDGVTSSLFFGFGG